MSSTTGSNKRSRNSIILILGRVIRQPVKMVGLGIKKSGRDQYGHVEQSRGGRHYYSQAAGQARSFLRPGPWTLLLRREATQCRVPETRAR